MSREKITISDVRPGDHLHRCRYRWFGIQHGIAVRFDKFSPMFVVTTSKKTLHCVPLIEFVGRGTLQRSIASRHDRLKQRDALEKPVILRRPAEEIVQNALLLLDWFKIAPERVRKLLEDDLSQFARRCSTTMHHQWLTCFQPVHEKGKSTSSTGNQFLLDLWISFPFFLERTSAFNKALLCGMPFRQASHIGTREFRIHHQAWQKWTWCTLISSISATNAFSRLSPYCTHVRLVYHVASDLADKTHTRISSVELTHWIVLALPLLVCLVWNEVRSKVNTSLPSRASLLFRHEE